MGDGAFQLTGEAAGLTAPALAVRLGVSDQTVLNYRAAGMPIIGVDTADGFDRYDEADCRAWIAANKPQGGKGGKRPGAGRPKGSTNKAKQLPPSPVAAGVSTPAAATPHEKEVVGGVGVGVGVSGGGGGGGGGEDDPNIFIAAKNRKVKLPEIRCAEDIVKYLSAGETSAAELDSLKAAQELYRKQLDIDEREKVLVAVSEVRLAVADAQRVAVRSLAGLPAKAALAIGAELGLDSAQCQVLRGRLMDLVQDVQGLVSLDPLAAEKKAEAA